MRVKFAGVVTSAVVAALAGAAHAQVRFGDGVEIGDVVSSTLAGSPDIERAGVAVEAQVGARVLAASPFDLQLRAALQRARDHLPLVSARNGILVAETVETRTSAVKSFRAGLIVSSDLSFARVRTGTTGPATKQVDSSVSVRIPLAGGRGGGSAAGEERAAQESVTASRLERDHIAARAVRDAVLAYWRYLAARERLRTYVESAERAQRLVGETEVLIRADERPASDLDLVASNRAQKLTVVNGARQTLLDAKYDLGIAMGLGAGAIRTLGAPLTTFPETAIDCGSSFEPEARSAAVRTALAGRRDLAAVRARRDGARLAWEGVRKDLRSRWDVVTRLGYTRVGRRAGSEAGASLVQGAGGLNGLVQVQYEPIVTNRAVRGRAMVGAASHRASVVAADDLSRRIEANVLVAIEALDSAAREALAAEQAVRLSGRSVLTEQEKFRLGLATLFDAILAEDSLTSARLQQTTARFRFAAALLKFRFETGTLLDGTAGAVSVDLSRMTSFVVEECKP